MGKPKHLQAVMDYAMETAESQHMEEMQPPGAFCRICDQDAGSFGRGCRSS